MFESRLDERTLVDICSKMIIEKQNDDFNHIKMSINGQCLKTTIPVKNDGFNHQPIEVNLYSNMKDGSIIDVEVCLKNNDHEKIIPSLNIEQKEMIINSANEIFDITFGEKVPLNDYLKFNDSQLDIINKNNDCVDAIKNFEGVITKTLTKANTMTALVRGMGGECVRNNILDNARLVAGMINGFEIPSDYVEYLNSEIESLQSNDSLCLTNKVNGLRDMVNGLKYIMSYNIAKLYDETKFLLDNEYSHFNEGMIQFAVKGQTQLNVIQDAVKILKIQEKEKEIPKEMMDELQLCLFTNIGSAFVVKSEDIEHLNNLIKRPDENKTTKKTKQKDLSYLKE